jgi:hypothetical protein
MTIAINIFLTVISIIIITNIIISNWIWIPHALINIIFLAQHNCQVPVLVRMWPKAVQEVECILSVPVCVCTCKYVHMCMCIPGTGSEFS